DGTKIVLGNIKGGLAVFDARTYEHLWSFPLRYWQASVFHLHRWFHGRLLAACAFPEEIIGDRAAAFVADMDARSARPLSVQPEFALVFDPLKLTLDAQGRLLLFTPARSATFSVLRIPSLQAEGRPVTIRQAFYE